MYNKNEGPRNGSMTRAMQQVERDSELANQNKPITPTKQVAPSSGGTLMGA